MVFQFLSVILQEQEEDSYLKEKLDREDVCLKDKFILDLRGLY